MYSSRACLAFFCASCSAKVARSQCLHRDLGVVGCSQSFFGANSVYPLVHRLLVGLLQFIQLQVIHRCGILEERWWMVNRWANHSLKINALPSRKSLIERSCRQIFISPFNVLVNDESPWSHSTLRPRVVFRLRFPSPATKRKIHDDFSDTGASIHSGRARYCCGAQQDQQRTNKIGDLHLSGLFAVGIVYALSQPDLRREPRASSVQLCFPAAGGCVAGCPGL